MTAPALCQEHAWERRPEQDGYSLVQRFCCTRCGVWGYRKFKPRLPPIRAYAGNPTEPDPTWTTTYPASNKNIDPLERPERGADGSDAPLKHRSR